MGMWRATTATLATAALWLGCAAAGEPTAVPLDQAATLDGVEVACTGIGQTRQDPRWFAYPVRIEFADARANYLAGERLVVSDVRGRRLVEAACDGPWVLLKLPAGRTYRVVGHVTEAGAAAQGGTFEVPSQGQRRVVLTFPDAR